MIETHPEAEIEFTRAYSPLGPKSWNWVELALPIPYLLISVSVESEAASIRRNFLFGSIIEAMSLMDATRDASQQMEIGLLSPGYMNGSDFYQLGRLKEIWRSRVGNTQMFVMTDGKKFNFPPKEFAPIDQEMELIVSI